MHANMTAIICLVLYVNLYSLISYDNEPCSNSSGASWASHVKCAHAEGQSQFLTDWQMSQAFAM